MNITEIKDNWNVLKGKLIQQYGDLTENDLKFAEKKMNFGIDSIKGR